MGQSKGPFPWALIGAWVLTLVVLAVTGWSVWLILQPV